MLKTALLFQDHMTLQRDKEIPVWGTADPGASVSVSLQGKTSDTAADSEGKWKVLCGPFETSFREEMTIVSGSDKIILSSVNTDSGGRQSRISLSGSPLSHIISQRTSKESTIFLWESWDATGEVLLPAHGCRKIWSGKAAGRFIWMSMRSH